MQKLGNVLYMGFFISIANILEPLESNKSGVLSVNYHDKVKLFKIYIYIYIEIIVLCMHSISKQKHIFISVFGEFLDEISIFDGNVR